MTLNESVNTLQGLLSNLKASDAKFAADLIASFKKYGSLTPKQAPWIERLIARATTPAPVFSAPLVLATAQPSQNAPVVNVGGFEGVVTLFTTAKAYLKFPKITLLCEGKQVKLSLLGAKSKHAGAVNITDGGKYPYAVWYGRVSADGSFVAGHALPGLVDLLKTFSQNPARVAKDHGKLTGNCCFCNKAIGLGKEQRSVLVGFGPDCAEHYGLKAEWLAGVAKAEAKASVSTSEVPTLTVSPSAQAVINGLAESLAKATGAVSVTVTDGQTTSTFNPDELQAELGPDYIPVATVLAKAEADEDLAKLATIDVATIEAAECFFCEQLSTETKSLHGYAVCPACIGQLNKTPDVN